ncbi:hypothetical protein C1645_818050 [Glomus cerebriforme]|uniref:Uncharacterized protein n=1 Tax=Glomus cerebriforme TaxID=658196 RepID=A0A397TDM0_9GLOM|nr:hypothetical protein C1645_818050 [Glomus cerebriforme]
MILPKLQQNVCDVILYDILGKWDAEKITEEINKYLGSLVKATLSKQGKYTCVRATIVLRTSVLNVFEEGFEEHLIFQDEEFMRFHHLAAIKLVKDSKGKQKLIRFFRTSDDLTSACQAEFNVHELIAKWKVDNIGKKKSDPNIYRPKFPLQRKIRTLKSPSLSPQKWAKEMIIALKITNGTGSWKTAVIFNFENKMGVTISQHTDLFYNEYIASLEAKNYCRLEWGVSDNTAISRNILYLVGRVVSKFYEESMNKCVRRLEAIYEESQAKDLTISELTTNLKVARDMIAKLQQERTNHTYSSIQTPINIENTNLPNKKKNKELTPHIVTGYTIPPTLKKNVRDVMLYDIPGSWDAEKITEEINKHLGFLIKASVTAKGKYRCVRFPGDWSLAQRQQQLSQQAVIKDLPSICKELDIFNNQEFKESFNWEAIKLVKTPKGSKLIGYFGHHDDLIKALRQPFIISNKSYNWSHDTFSKNKSPDKKSRGSKDTSKKSKHSSKDSTKKNKPKTRSSSSSSTGSIAEVLATLVQLLTKQESKKSRKRSKSRGGSKAN